MKLSTEIYTSKVKECRDFYIKHFGFQVKLELEGFVVLQHKIQTAYELLFCIPGSQFVHPLFHPEYQGKGVIFQIEVPDVMQEYDRIKKNDVHVILDLVHEPGNGHHFTIQDPSGMLVDVVQFD